MTHTPVAIIGSGPAGYTAAVYAARAKLEPVLFAGYQSGGQLMYTSDVENFPGFEQGVGGIELMTTMRAQAERFGTKMVDEYVTAVDVSQRPFKIWTNVPDDVDPEIVTKGKPEEVVIAMEKIRQAEPSYTADSIIVSTGASSIMLGVPGEHELLGKGVSTCAVCDAAFYKDKNTFVVGGGDSAMEDTLALIKFAKSITVVHRRDAFRASKIMQERVLNHPHVKVLWNSQITKVNGKDSLASIEVETTEADGGKKVQEVPADGIFVAIGHRPITQIFQGQLELDSRGYLVTRQSYSQQGLKLAGAAINEKGLVDFPTMTSVEGVFGAGDVVDVRYKQAINAAGQGAAAAIDAERWLENLG